jgi:hypothetical protein
MTFMTFMMMIIACSALMLLDAPALAEKPVVATAVRAQHLELPRMTGLELPPPGPPLGDPQIPTGFFGCWIGTPVKFDTILPALEPASLYRLRRVTKCYLPGRIKTQEYTLELTPKHRLLNTVLSFLSLGSHSAQVAQENTAVHGLAPRQIYSRGMLTLNLTESSLLKFPQTTQATVVDEEVATLVDPDHVAIVGRAFLTGAGTRSVGTWHADLHH